MKFNIHKSKEYPYKERDLSILEFNARVLDLAKDSTIPPIERLKFVEIVFNNIDEFISIKLSDCKANYKKQYKSIISLIYKEMDKLLEEIVSEFNIKISTMVSDTIRSSYFVDGGIYYVYIDNNDKFNIVPLTLSTSITEERIRILHPNTTIKYSFAIRFVSDKSFNYIYTGENTLSILTEIKSLIKIKDASVFNYIQTTCDSYSIMTEFLKQMSIELEGYIHVSENIMCIKEIMKNIISLNKESNLYYTKFTPSYNSNINYMAEVIKKDIMIRTPYEAYSHVTDFIEQMCTSKNIKTVFCTLYRTAEDSVIVDSLIHAKKCNKSVYVYVEPTARGNEERNVLLIEKLLNHKIHVSCNYFNYKVHSKIFCAIDDNGIVYTHVGTGNYNEDTAKVYTDLHLLTCNPSISTQVLKVFMCLLKKKIYFPDTSIVDKGLFASPINLREEIIRCIDNEIKKKERGRIYIKCNSLCDLQVIDKLYKAGKSGVNIRIIARSAVSILPIYKNIQIRSKVGRFLEHDRIYMFGDSMYISSADLLLRNINKRVEILCSITDNECKSKIFNIFDRLWNDAQLHYVGRDYKWHTLISNML